MDQQILKEKLSLYLSTNKDNYISKEKALDVKDVGMPIFDSDILVGCASADDPLFKALKKPDIIGDFVMLPGEWLDGAKTVISFFLPFSDEIREANAADLKHFTDSWRNARIDGQALLNDVSVFLQEELKREGYGACVPAIDSRFRYGLLGADKLKIYGGVSFASTWSERHAAYICGLGTFGISRNFITEKGSCGRFGSVITTAELPLSTRSYDGVYDYCTYCGACARNCPANAIDIKKGKSQYKCFIHVEKSNTTDKSYYGCGKCQVGVPCAKGIPGRK